MAVWHGQRVLGVEGSYLHLPDTEERRREVSGPTNHHVGGEQVQGLAAVRYALRNDVGLRAALGLKPAEKHLWFGTH